MASDDLDRLRAMVEAGASASPIDNLRGCADSGIAHGPLMSAKDRARYEALAVIYRAAANVLVVAPELLAVAEAAGRCDTGAPTRAAQIALGVALDALRAKLAEVVR